jgi:hypothetical protein
MDAAELIVIDLDDEERRLFRMGIREWSGPARCTEEFAVAMGFHGRQDLFDQTDRLMAAILEGAAMTRLDWFRVLIATEVVFASSLVGSGLDWPITTGMSDADSLEILRQVQRKLTREVRGLIGDGLGVRLDGPAT